MRQPKKPRGRLRNFTIEVTCGSITKTYVTQARAPYQARSKARTQFLQEHPSVSGNVISRKVGVENVE